MDAKKAAKVSSIYLIATLFNRGISFLTVPIFTRLLSTSDYGIVTTYTSWVSVVAMIIGCSLHMGIRAAYIDFFDKVKEVTSTVISFTLLIFSGITAVVCVGILCLHIDVNLSLVLMCLIQGLFSAIITDYSMHLMMQYRYKLRTLLMIGPNLLSAIAAIIVIVFVMDSDLYLGRIYTYCGAYIVFGLLVLFLCFKEYKPGMQKKYLKYTLSISAPLILHGIALDILSQSDRVMITWLADASQTGIYSLVYNFSMVSTVITTALDGLWIPWFTQKMKENSYSKINLFGKHYISFMTYVMVALILVAPELLKIFAPSSYWGGINIIPLIIIANYLIFLYTMYVNVEHFYKKTVYVSINTSIAAVTNIVLNYFLIPKWGYIAAAFTTLISYLLSFILHMFYSKKLNKELFPIKLFLMPLLHIAVSVGIFYLFVDQWIIRWILTIFYIILVFIFERKNIGKLFPGLAKKTSILR